MSIRAVITELGGITGLARGLGHRNVTTVQGWWERERIPARRQREVLDFANGLGKAIAADRLIPPAEGG